MEVSLSRTPVFAATIAVVALALLVFCGLWTGCSNIFAPEQREPEDHPLTPTKPQTSPDSVLFNFESALNHKDLEVYKRCLSRDFQFIDPHLSATDVNALYGYDDEVAIIENMFNQEQVEIQWRFGALRHTGGGTGTVDALEGIQSVEAYFQVTVFDGASAQTASGTQKYKFIEENKDRWVIIENRDESIPPEGF
jgi:hypothetical protein